MFRRFSVKDFLRAFLTLYSYCAIIFLVNAKMKFNFRCQRGKRSELRVILFSRFVIIRCHGKEACDRLLIG